MAKAGENNDMHTDRSAEENNVMFPEQSTVRGQNIELESITEQVGCMKRMASAFETSLTKMEDGENKVGHVDELDKWVYSLESILEDVPSYMCNPGHPGRISRIPENLRQVDVKGYEPYILSIGPYHFGKQRVQPGEMRKRFALKCVLINNPKLTIKDFMTEIVRILPTVRSFYSDVEMKNENFVQMLLIDSVYIISTFCGLGKGVERTNNITTRVENHDESLEEIQINEVTVTGDDNLMVRADKPIGEMSTAENWYWALLAHDLFLIENQIPFFLLQTIYNLAYGGSGIQFIDIIKYEVANMLTYYTKADSNKVILKSEEVHHLLHLGHMFFLPTIKQDLTTEQFQESWQMFRLGSAVQLYESGVHFEARSDLSNYSLLDITFDSNGRMIMPCLHVDDNTESLIRNLIALEQMKYPLMGLHISAYIVLLLHLISTPKDVEVLRRKGIIQHHLASDKEMMYLVNRLSKGLAFDYVEDEYSLKQVFHELKNYSDRRVPRWRAWLKHRHFSNPWTTISLLAASLLLILTVVQTYYTVYSFYYPYFNGHP